MKVRGFSLVEVLLVCALTALLAVGARLSFVAVRPEESDADALARWMTLAIARAERLGRPASFKGYVPQSLYPRGALRVRVDGAAEWFLPRKGQLVYEGQVREWKYEPGVHTLTPAGTLGIRFGGKTEKVKVSGRGAVTGSEGGR